MLWWMMSTSGLEGGVRRFCEDSGKEKDFFAVSLKRRRDGGELKMGFWTTKEKNPLTRC